MLTTKEQVVSSGYAVGFEALIQSVLAVLPTNEVIEQALRKTVPMFPPLVVREVVANALIHQDFAVTGASPMIEVFDDRVEITKTPVGRSCLPIGCSTSRHVRAMRSSRLLCGASASARSAAAALTRSCP